MYTKTNTIKSLKTGINYFPNLDGLRAIAALSVILSHIEAARKHAGLTKAVPNSIIGLSGNLPVTLFFVLSGFLITTLLVREKETKGQINVKAFYMRRMLRIWPLFYLVLLISYLVIPFFFPVSEKSISITGILLNSLFLTNFALGFQYMAPFASHLWTIGVEEQFYLIWPLFIKKISKEYLLRTVFGVFVLISAFKLILQLNSHTSGFMSALSFSWGYSKFNCILTGALIAIIIPTKKESFSLLDNIYCYLCSKTTQFFTISLLAVLMVLQSAGNIQIPQQIYACLFAIVILNAATNKCTIFNLSNPWLNYTGKISFGIYMLHYMVAEIFTRTFSTYLQTHPMWLQTIIIYISVYTFTILLAHLSYKYLEQYFGTLKKRWNLTKTTTS